MMRLAATLVENLESGVVIREGRLEILHLEVINFEGLLVVRVAGGK